MLIRAALKLSCHFREPKVHFLAVSFKDKKMNLQLPFPPAAENLSCHHVSRFAGWPIQKFSCVSLGPL